MRIKTPGVREAYQNRAPTSRLYFLGAILDDAKSQVNGIGRLDLAIGNGPLARATIEVNSMLEEAKGLEVGLKVPSGILAGLKFRSRANVEKRWELEARVEALSKKVQERIATIADNARQIVAKALGQAKDAMGVFGGEVKLQEAGMDEYYSVPKNANGEAVLQKAAVKPVVVTDAMEKLGGNGNGQTVATPRTGEIPYVTDAMEKLGGNAGNGAAGFAIGSDGHALPSYDPYQIPE